MILRQRTSKATLPMSVVLILPINRPVKICSVLVEIWVVYELSYNIRCLKLNVYDLFSRYQGRECLKSGSANIFAFVIGQTNSG